MKRSLATLVALLCVLIARESRADNLIAVLPLDVSNADGKLSKAAGASLEEMLRDAATNSLAPAGWTVLTGETTIRILRDNGVKPEECGNQSCHLDMAREIKASKFLSGNVQYVEGQYIASIRLIDTATGKILASERLMGKTVTSLQLAFDGKSRAFFARGGLLDSATPAAAPRETSTEPPAVDENRPQVKRGRVTEAVGSFTVTAKPAESVRLELTSPAGKKIVSAVPYKNEAATPGRWRVVAKASGYEDEVQEVAVAPDDITLVKLTMKQLGALSITGEPAGSAVTVTGPGDFKDEGGLPWEATGLRSGSYQVRVARTGYADASHRVEVTPGKTATFNVTLRKTLDDAVASKNVNPHPIVVMKTSLGEIVLELDQAKAPITVANFLRYAKEGFYEGTIFHRVIDGFMIQGGGHTTDLAEKEGHAPIRNEANNGLKNDRGTIAMARTADPNSATSQFFINVVNNNTLNYPNLGGYTVFGKVISGMDVVDEIKAVKTQKVSNGMNDVPVTLVLIESVTVKQ